MMAFSHGSSELVTVFLSGDVMLGRGLDQILPYPSDPEIHESYMESARDYLMIAQLATGPIPRPVSFSYPWGDAIDVLNERAPDLRLINLETSVTTSSNWEPKGINYRMHPRNIGCLIAAGIHGCALANNHILDWGPEGLLETIDTLAQAGIQHAGAGRDFEEAWRPATFALQGGGRVLLFSIGLPTSGVPEEWAAWKDRPGVSYLGDCSRRSVQFLKERIEAAKRPGDVVIMSIHWGGNWGYGIPSSQRRFAHALIEEAGVDVIHGHSSHHVKGIETHQGKLILYGCGDLLNDYEGIEGYERYRDDLSLLYFAQLRRGSGQLHALDMVPMQIRHFRLNHASPDDGRWLREVLSAEGRELGTGASALSDGALRLSR